MAVIHRKSLGDIQILTVDADPSGAEAAPVASEARLIDGSATWINTDGATSWQRNDGRASEARGFTDGDSTSLSYATVGDGEPLVRDGVTVRSNPGAPAGYASAFLYAGSRTVAELNALSPTHGEAYVVTGATGTPTAGSSDEVSEGDVAEFDGTSWKRTVENSGGFVPAGTRLLVASTLLGITLQAPLADPGDSAKLATFSGSSNTPALTTPTAGTMVLIRAGIGILSLVGLNEIPGLGRAWAGVISDDLMGRGLKVEGAFRPEAKIGSGLAFDGNDQIIPSIDASTIVDNGGSLEVGTAAVAAAVADGSTIVESGGELSVDPAAHSHTQHQLLVDDALTAWYCGGHTVAGLDLLTGRDLYQGMTFRAESAGTPAYSGSALLAVGDLAQWTQDAGWQVIAANVGGYVPAGTRVYIAGQPSVLRDEAVGNHGKGATFPGDASAAVVDSSLQPDGALLNIAGSGFQPNARLQLSIEGANGRWDPLGGWEFTARKAGIVASTTVAPAAFDDVINFNSPLIPNDQKWVVTWTVAITASDNTYAVFLRGRWNDQSSKLIGDEDAQEYLPKSGNTMRRFVTVQDTIFINNAARTSMAVEFSVEIGTENAASEARSWFASMTVKQLVGGGGLDL